MEGTMDEPGSRKNDYQGNHNRVGDDGRGVSSKVSHKAFSLNMQLVLSM